MTQRPRHTHGQAGFSLVEMLVVLVVVGLVSSVVLLNARPSRPGLAEEADRFARTLAEARDTALIGNRPVLVEVTPDGHALRRRTGDGWSQPASGEAVSWETGASVQAEGRRFPLAILFDPMGLSDALTLTIYRDGRSETVELDGTGSVRRTGGRHG